MVRQITKKQIEAFSRLVSYDPDTGELTWLVERHGHGGAYPIGSVAGRKAVSGYIRVGLGGLQCRAHRVAWFLMTGSDVPEGKEIDHINRDRADNRWANLRLVDRSRNNHNSNPHRNNTSGVKGVSWVERDGKWSAYIKIGGRVHGLGKFARFEGAVAARVAAEKALLGESPTEVTGVPAPPKKARVVKPRWIDENKDTFRANRTLVVRSSNTSGCPGVRLHKKSGMWQARIVVNGKEISLGYFKDMEGAVDARLSAERQHYGKTHKD